MPRLSGAAFAIPEFQGATRRLVLLNLAAYFLLLLFRAASPESGMAAYAICSLDPASFLHGYLWQPFTYSLVHTGLTGVLLELISLWFVVGFLENLHASNWVMNLYIVSVLGAAVAAVAIYAVSLPLGLATVSIPLAGCMGGIFGCLVAIGLIHGETQFLLFFVLGVKAKYLVAIYAIVAVAMLFGQQRMYAFAQLGGAVAGYLWVKLAPRRGFSVQFRFSEGWYGLRNRYYRWKRRRAARKFEVYMRQQGRTVHFDGQGRKIDDPEDKSRWN
jgi:membrane associated rhomboid family serine protease